MLHKKEHPSEKPGLHPRNQHRERYDLNALTASCPELGTFVKLNNYGDESVDFFDPEAVKTLNRALLRHHYGIAHWDLPQGYLCPPIPGRADYIHHIADLLHHTIAGKTIPGERIRCLDIGVGANCVYPIIGSQEYGWSFTGADIDPKAIASAQQIVAKNPSLNEKVELRLQTDPKAVFRGIIREGEHFDLTICNPPFHASAAEAESGTMRKLKNLKKGRIDKPVLNFGGRNNELWCTGGEERFVKDMIYESRQFANSCLWFSTLISKESNLKKVYGILQKVEAAEVKTIQMVHGNKTSRIVAWTFLSARERQKWFAG